MRGVLPVPPVLDVGQRLVGGKVEVDEALQLRQLWRRYAVGAVVTVRTVMQQGGHEDP